MIYVYFPPRLIPIEPDMDINDRLTEAVVFCHLPHVTKQERRSRLGTATAYRREALPDGSTHDTHDSLHDGRERCRGWKAHQEEV